MEAIACVGMNHFYEDCPEISLIFYRRLLQMGVSNAELYNNLGLCCFYAQQYDMSLACMDRALSLASDPDTLGKHNCIIMHQKFLIYMHYIVNDPHVDYNLHCIFVYFS